MAQQERGKRESADFRIPPLKIAQTLLLVLTFAALPLGGIYLVKEWIFARAYGRLLVELRLPEESPQWLIESPEIKLYRQRGDELGRGRNISLHYSRTDNLLSSRSAYYPSGYYRLLLNYLDGMEWVSFYLPNRQEQREKEEKALIVGRNLNSVSNFPLDLQVTVSDCLTNKDLTSASVVEVLGEGQQWVSLSEVTTRLRTDRTYSIRVHLEGYQPFYQTQYISVLQRHAVFSAAMIPEPALLYLEGSSNGVELNIEGSRKYLSLEDSPRWKRLIFDGEPLHLLAGEYHLEFTYQGIEYPVTLELVSGEARWIRWEAGENSLKIIYDNS